MVMWQRTSLSKKLALFILATTLLLTSAHGGRFDDVAVIPLDHPSLCIRCIPCPINQNIGDCGENYIVTSLRNKKIPAFFAQHDKKHGIDIVAFTKFKGKDLIILHESKMSKSARITSAEFKKRLGRPKSGRQSSRTWLNDALIKMKDSKDPKILDLSSIIESKLSNGAYFVRTGNLRVDTHKGSYLQFFALTDKPSEKYDLESNTYFTNGPFLREWRNQYGNGFVPQGKELSLYPESIAWLNFLFQ